MVSILTMSIGWHFSGAAKSITEALVSRIEVKKSHQFSTIPGCIGNIFIGTGQPSLKFVTTSLGGLLIDFPSATKKKEGKSLLFVKKILKKFTG
jgi:hypothetical protein